MKAFIKDKWTVQIDSDQIHVPYQARQYFVMTVDPNYILTRYSLSLSPNVVSDPTAWKDTLDGVKDHSLDGHVYNAFIYSDQPVIWTTPIFTPLSTYISWWFGPQSYIFVQVWLPPLTEWYVQPFIVHNARKMEKKSTFLITQTTGQLTRWNIVLHFNTQLSTLSNWSWWELGRCIWLKN